MEKCVEMAGCVRYQYQIPIQEHHHTANVYCANAYQYNPVALAVSIGSNNRGQTTDVSMTSSGMKRGEQSKCRGGPLGPN